METIFTDGADLRRERKARGLSQDRLAVLSGITPESRHIGKIERGEVEPKAETARRISRALLAVPIAPNSGESSREGA